MASLQQLGSGKLGARLWRLPPFSANTWHRHTEQDELYFVLEGTGRIRVAAETVTVPKHGAVLVRPPCLRQVFNDTEEEVRKLGRVTLDFGRRRLIADSL
jgi:mannose-6-phosphate isomerase-like protein (cupin superfamily)